MTDETTVTENTPAAEDSAELTINDLSAIKTIIDVASSRGTFKPNEMVPVGTIYLKLEKFLAAATAASSKATPNA